MATGRAGNALAITRGDESLSGYLSLPASGRGPGVLVIHEGMGLVDHTRDVCDRLAREGFCALAPDLYRGRVAADRSEAVRLMLGLERDEVGADLDAAVDALFGCNGVDGSRVGALGFCMGGSLALLLGTRNRRVAAVADFYGAHPGIQPDIAELKAAFLGIFAAEDEFISSEQVEALREQLEAAGVRSHLEIQPGVAHGFMNDARPESYDANAAASGWDKLLSFLRAELA